MTKMFVLLSGGTCFEQEFEHCEPDCVTERVEESGGQIRNV